MPPRKEIVHGTHLGYKTHVRRKEKGCKECLEAWRVHQLARAREKGVKPLLKPKSPDMIKHGTTSGYEKHRRLKQPTCKACRAAHAAEARRRTAARTPEVREAERLATKEARAKKIRNGRVPIPLEMFVQLWYTADKKTLEMMDGHFGKDQVDKWIKMNEEAQGASNS